MKSNKIATGVFIITVLLIAKFSDLSAFKCCTIMTGYGTKVVTTTMITGKGQQYFINHYVKNMNEQELERL